MSQSDSKKPVFVAAVFIVVGLIIGLMGQNVVGAIVAGIGIVPSCWGMWTGMQQRTQGTMALAILAFIGCLGVAGLLVLRGVFNLFA